MHEHDFAEGDRKVICAVLVNLLLTIAQIVGGLVSENFALMAVAIHNLSDAMALIIAFGARKIARLPPVGLIKAPLAAIPALCAINMRFDLTRTRHGEIQSLLAECAAKMPL